MANRYWVGGAGTWNTSTTTHWSSTSGGTGGSSVPAIGDNVFFDSSSGGGAVQVLSGAACGSFSSVGFTGSFTAANVTLFTNTPNASFTMGVDFPGNYQNSSSSGTCVITSNGHTLGELILNGIPPTVVSLADDLVVTGVIDLVGGTLTTNNHNVTCGYVTALTSGFTNTLNLGSSTLTLTGTNSTVFDMSVGTNTVNAGTSTIIIQSSASALTFNGSGLTFNNVVYKGGGGGLTVKGSNTFNDFKIDAIDQTVNFTAGTTQTVSTFTVSGSAGNLNTLQSTSSGSQWTVSASSGTISVDYIALQDSVATGGATWSPGSHSVDNGNNVGWFPGTPESTTQGSVARIATGGSKTQTSVANIIGAKRYSRGGYASLPTGNSDLTTIYTSTEVSHVSSHDGVYVDDVSNQAYRVHQFVQNNGNLNPLSEINPVWIGKCGQAASVANVVLQIYNLNTSAWETLDTDSTTAAGTDLTLNGSIVSNISHYLDTNGDSYFRVYQ